MFYNLPNNPFQGSANNKRSLYDLYIMTGNLPTLPRHYDVIAEMNAAIPKDVPFSQLRLNVGTLLLSSSCSATTLVRDIGIPATIIDFNFRQKLEKATFTYTPPNTSINIQKSLTVLTSIVDQDIFSWQAEFRDTATACRWDEQTATHVLHSVTTNELLGLYEGKETVEERIEAIFKYKYNESNGLKLQTELASLKQFKLPTTAIYMTCISELTRRLAIIHDWSDIDRARKIEESFYNGLTRRTQLEMSKINVTTVAEMYDVIRKTESTILAQLSTKPQVARTQIQHNLTKKVKPWRHDSEVYSNSHERANTGRHSEVGYNSFNRRGNNASRFTSSYKQPGWVNRPRAPQYQTGRPYSGSWSQNNRNSRFRGRSDRTSFNSSRDGNRHQRYNGPRQGEDNGHGGSSVNCIRETPSSPRILTIQTTLNNYKANTILDTGAAYSYISRPLIKKVKIETTEVKPVTAEMANGDAIVISEIAETTILLSNDRTHKYKVKLRVLESETDSIILGMDFLEANKCLIDLKSNRVTVDGTYHEFEPRTLQNQDFDNELTQKTKIYTCVEVKEEENGRKACLEAITAYKDNNPILGNIKGTSFHITLNKPFLPILKEYPIPYKLQSEVREEINKLKTLGVIETSDAFHFSPAFPILKRNGNIRLVIDYRELNSATEKLHYPIPKIHDSLVDVRGATIFSQLDLNMGYYQIPIDESSREQTAFVIDGQTYQFRRMPFGLCNAPFFFQKALSKIFKDVRFVKIYLDDLLIFSKTAKEHHKHVVFVLQKLKENNISINFQKSEFLKKTVKYLGVILNKEGTKADISRVDALDKIKPKNKRQVAKVLGMINWFRPFLMNCSLVTSFLSEKLRKEEPFKWEQKDSKELQEITKMIKHQTLLNFPNLEDEFLLTTDASEKGAGAVLSQNGKLIGLFSYKFNNTELNYSIVEKESYAIVKAVQHFKRLLLLAKIRIKTDNRNSTFNGTLSKRLNRWKLLLAEYEIELETIKGSENIGADALSRLFLIKEPTAKLKVDLEIIKQEQTKA